MNKFCKSSLCVENVRESNVLICRRLVDVPGVDAIWFAVFALICVELRLCEVLALLAVGRSQCWKDSGSKDAGRAAAGTC